MLEKIGIWTDRVVDGMAVLAGLLLLFMMFSICYEVIFRFFLFNPPCWVTEISEYILLYTTYLGATWVLRQDGHVKVDILLSRMGDRHQEIMNILNSLLCSVTNLVLVWYGGAVTLEYFRKGIPVIKSLSVPKYILLVVIPLGSLMLSIQFIRMLYGHVIRFLSHTAVAGAREKA